MSWLKTSSIQKTTSRGKDRTSRGQVLGQVLEQVLDKSWDEPWMQLDALMRVGGLRPLDAAVAALFQADVALSPVILSALGIMCWMARHFCGHLVEISACTWCTVLDGPAFCQWSLSRNFCVRTGRRVADGHGTTSEAVRRKLLAV